MTEFTTPDESILGALDGHVYIAIQRVVRRPSAGGPEEYYGPLREWLATPAAQLIEREQRIAQLQRLLDQALAERAEAQAQQAAIAAAERTTTEHYERELAELRRRIAELQVPTPAEVLPAAPALVVELEAAPLAEVEVINQDAVPASERPLQPGRVRCPNCQKQIWKIRLTEHRCPEPTNIVRAAAAATVPTALRLVEPPEDVPGWRCPRCERDAFARAIQRDICVDCVRQEQPRAA